jgi:uncharacterized protein (TIGR02391 family)
MSKLADILPTSASLLALSAEDLGMVLIEFCQTHKDQQLILDNFVAPFYSGNSPPYAYETKKHVTRAVAEAWQWLISEGLIVRDPDHSVDWFFMSRKGENLKTHLDIEAYKQGHLLPVSLLHPRLAEKVLPMFMRGDYDVAVFQAFKELEVTVRRVAELPDDLLGVKLMREAFKPENGKLTRRDLVAGEKVAMMELYAGAMGHFKNPPSHRNVTIDRAAAAQVICFASYLLGEAEFAGALS